VTSHEAIRSRATALVNDLQAAGKTVTTAESCTGGWIAKALTDVAGSSACFAYGIVSYSNGAKESLLGVANQTLEDNGAVSEATVAEMARGALSLSGADISVAVSGIAGPGGGSDEKPVGTVCFAWATRDAAQIAVVTAVKHFNGDRDSVRRLTVDHALAGIQELLQA
jgi:nicotinamide-nucleotide amidase